MGLMLAEPGFHTRCFVEWEEYPRQAIIAAQRAGYFAPAPIWDDVTTFDGRPFRGAIDTILAGYPCQPFSHAGQRRGEDDERHLWPEVARIIREVEPRWVFLENVAGHVTLGAETVLRELWDMGWTPAAGLFSASETGAPHERLRWFCVAYRSQERREGGERQRERYSVGAQLGDEGGNVENAIGAGAGGGTSDAGERGRDAVDWRGEGLRSGNRAAGADWPAADGQSQRSPVDDAPSSRRHAARIGPGSDIEGGGVGAGGDVGHPARLGCGEGRAEPEFRGGRDTAPGAGGELADARSPERQGQQPGQRDAGGRQEPHGPPALPGGTGLFPPGPGDADAWAAILRSAPDMAPAASARDLHAWARRLEAHGREWWEAEAEPGFCRMVTGLSARSQPLRLLGNAVVPICAAHAWRSLARAHGLHPIIIGDEE